MWSSEETSKPASWEVLHRWQWLKTEMRDWKEGSKRLERRSESKEKPRKKKLQRDKGGKGSEERTMSM